MAEPLYAYVPVAALRELAEYADLKRSYADSQFVCSTAEQKDSDDEFRAKVAALGIPNLLPDEEGAG